MPDGSCKRHLSLMVLTDSPSKTKVLSDTFSDTTSSSEISGPVVSSFDVEPSTLKLLAGTVKVLPSL